MTDQIETISLWIVIPSSALLVILAIITVFGLPSSVIERRKYQQSTQLQAAIRTTQDLLEIDWVKYKYMSRQYILDILQKNGWQYVDQAIDKNAWWLRFSPVSYNSVQLTPEVRLREELANATLDGQGRYRIDLTDYEILPRSDLERIIRSSGWQDKLWLSTIVQVAPE